MLKATNDIVKQIFRKYEDFFVPYKVYSNSALQTKTCLVGMSWFSIVLPPRITSQMGVLMCEDRGY